VTLIACAPHAATSNPVLDALREAAREGNVEEAVLRVLAQARDTVGAERAFLVEEGEEDGPPHVLGMASLRAEAPFPRALPSCPFSTLGSTHTR